MVITQLDLTLAAVFVSVVLLSGALITFFMSRASAGRRRLSELEKPRATTVLIEAPPPTRLSEAPTGAWDTIVETLPTSRGTTKRLRREMALAGWENPAAVAMFSIAEIVCPIVFALPAIFMLTGMNKWLGAGFGAFVGYMAPSLFLRLRTKGRQSQIENGLADALDLLVLCLEAGSSLDQAIVKAGEELQVAYPALGEQLRIVITEMRAGKPRLEAFRGLAERAQVDDVRQLVAMLVQTDRFGTSIAQALRTHSEVCRTKRRQRAEERAQKVGVKLVFPLVFCLFPALYVVMLGPAYLQFMKVFGAQ